MKAKSRSGRGAVILTAICFVAGCVGEPRTDQADQAPPVSAGASTAEACSAADARGRLDHVPIAVSDLDAAAGRFEAIGFSVRSGRPHANSVRNRFIELSDGTELELITASRPDDEIAAGYVEFLDAGEGGAFVAIRTDSLDRIESAAAAAGLRPDRFGAGAFDYLTFDHPGLAQVFLFRGPASPDPQAGAAGHANGATGLAEVWLDETDGLLELLELLGGTRCGRLLTASGDAGDAYAIGDVWLVAASAPTASTATDDSGTRPRIRGVTLWVDGDSLPRPAVVSGVRFEFRRHPTDG